MFGPVTVATTSAPSSPDFGAIFSTDAEFDGMPQTQPSAVTQPPCHFHPPAGTSPMSDTSSSAPSAASAGSRPMRSTPVAHAGTP